MFSHTWKLEIILPRQLRCQQSPKQPQSPPCVALHAPQHSSGIHRDRLTTRVANPRHNTDIEAQGDGSWDKDLAEPDHHASDTAPGVDWAKLQTLAFLAGASTLAAVVAVQLSGKADLQGMAYDTIPKPLQEALPQLGEDTNKGPLSQWDVGAAVQKFTVRQFRFCSVCLCTNLSQHCRYLSSIIDGQDCLVTCKHCQEATMPLCMHATHLQISQLNCCMIAANMHQLCEKADVDIPRFLLLSRHAGSRQQAGRGTDFAI